MKAMNIDEADSIGGANWAAYNTPKPRDYDSFVVTGKLTNGKQFKAIKTSNAAHAFGINLYDGSVWGVKNGKRTLLKRVYP